MGAQAAVSLFGQINSSLPRKKKHPQVTASRAEKKDVGGIAATGGEMLSDW